LTPNLKEHSIPRGDIYDVKDQALRWVKVKSFLAMAQQLGKTLFNQGDLSYIEVHSLTAHLILGRKYGDVTKCPWIF